MEEETQLINKIGAFGIPVFTAEAKSKSPLDIVQEMNVTIDRMGLSVDDIVNIHVEQEFYHVFYRIK